MLTVRKRKRNQYLDKSLEQTTIVQTQLTEAPAPTRCDPPSREVIIEKKKKGSPQLARKALEVEQPVRRSSRKLKSSK